MPLTGNVLFTPLGIQGRPLPPVPQRPLVHRHIVTVDLFATLGIRLKAGRLFTADDRALPPGPDGAPSRATGVVVVNEAFVRKHFPKENALGQILLFGQGDLQKFEIVGLVHDVKSAGLAQPVPEEVYFPREQSNSNFMTVVGRARPGLRAAAVIPVLRRVVTEIDPSLALAQTQTADQLVEQNIGVPRLTTTLLICFAAIAAFLAAVGIYSVMSYSVTQRTSEIGVRIALGASTSDVLRTIGGGATLQVALGLVLGLGGASGVTLLLRQALYEVQPFEPAIFAMVALFFAIIAAVACLIPVRRATRIDPMIALRAE